MEKGKAPKRRPGPVPRERVSFLVRADPEIAEWLTALAASGRRSRNQTVEVLLVAVQRAMERASDPEGVSEASPVQIVEVLGSVLVEELATAGLVPGFVRSAIEQVRAENEADAE